MWHVRDEQAKDAADVEELVIACFGAGRFAKTAYRLREGTTPVKGLSFVAVDDQSEKLIGSVRFSNIAIGGSASLLLGPPSVRPELRGKGINVNCVMPSIIDTPENRAGMPDTDPANWVSPEKLANVILFLCSEEASAVHGACVPVVGLSYRQFVSGTARVK